MPTWTIQTFYPAQDDKGRTFQAVCAYWVEAKDIPTAYAQADLAFKDRPGIRFGFILPGHHQMLPGFRPKEEDESNAHRPRHPHGPRP